MRTITLAGYVVVAAAAAAVEVVAARSGRIARLSGALRLALAARPVRLLLLVAWLWLGWHLFVRVDWR